MTPATRAAIREVVTRYQAGPSWDATGARIDIERNAPQWLAELLAALEAAEQRIANGPSWQAMEHHRKRAEQLATNLDLACADRDEWAQACKDANYRFEKAEARVKELEDMAGVWCEVHDAPEGPCPCCAAAEVVRLQKRVRELEHSLREQTRLRKLARELTDFEVDPDGGSEPHKGEE